MVLYWGGGVSKSTPPQRSVSSERVFEITRINPILPKRFNERNTVTVAIVLHDGVGSDEAAKKFSKCDVHRWQVVDCANAHA